MANIYTGSSDMAAFIDSLDMENRFMGIANFMCSCETPMTIAINGDWGSGKSSAMNIIQKILKEKHCAVPEQIVNFNTWEFSIFGEHDKLLLDLLQTMNNQLEKLAKKLTTPEKANSISRTTKALSITNGLSSVLAGAVNRIECVEALKDLLAGLSDGNSNDPHKELMVPSMTSVIMEIHNNINENIRTIMTNTTANHPDRMFIFIDDLDRLEPRVALELIEAMKNFASFENCVFVLAVDQKVVERGLRSKYGDDFDNETSVQFFDKIIQVPFELPVTAYNIEKYVSSLITEEEKPLAPKYAALLKTFNERNPRTIKRSFNLLRLYNCINNAGSSTIETSDADLKFKQYAVLLLKLKNSDAHVELASTVKNDVNYSENNQKLAEADKAFHSILTAKSNDMENSENNDQEKLIKAVLYRFYENIEADTQESLEATKQLIDVINMTKSENADYGLMPYADFVFKFYKLVNDDISSAMNIDLDVPSWTDFSAAFPTKSLFLRNDKDIIIDTGKQRSSNGATYGIKLIWKPADCRISISLWAPGIGSVTEKFSPYLTECYNSRKLASGNKHNDVITFFINDCTDLEMLRILLTECRFIGN